MRYPKVSTKSSPFYDEACNRLAAAKDLPGLCKALVYLVILNRVHYNQIYGKLEQIERKLSSAPATYKRPTM